MACCIDVGSGFVKGGVDVETCVVDTCLQEPIDVSWLIRKFRIDEGTTIWTHVISTNNFSLHIDMDHVTGFHQTEMASKARNIKT